MAEVTIRELRNHGGDVVDRAARGEQITITRAGQPVAELRPVPRQPLTAETLLDRWHRLALVTIAPCGQNSTRSWIRRCDRYR